jgi:hypothetical protein
MSYFIANTISISKDLKTFKVKGGDNNVVPRSNYWSKDIEIEKLYSCLNSGEIELRSKAEKACFINHLVRSMDFGGSWDEQTDYYHMKGLPESAEKLRTQIEEIKTTSNDYYKKQAEKKQKVLDNFDYWRKKLDDFDSEFLATLKHGLKNMPKEKYIIKIDIGYNAGYISKLYRNGASTTRRREGAMQLGKYRALIEKERFNDTIVEPYINI